MATSPPVVQSGAPAKLPIVPLLIAVVLGVVVSTMGVGGIVYYLVRSGRLPSQGSSSAKTEAVPSTATHAMTLEPLLVNLADSGGNAYLRVGLTLRVADAAGKNDTKTKDQKNNDTKGVKDAETTAAVRDTALMVMGRQTSDVLLSVDGKERLKAELKTALGEHNVDLKVSDLFFTEFLVQR